MTRNILRLALFCLLAVEVRAELVYQPPAAPESEAPWTSAGFSLLEGVARLFDSLAAVESKNADLANKYFDEAVSKFRNSETSYKNVLATLSDPRKIPFENLSMNQLRRIEQTFAFYKVPIPQTEAEVADLARSENQRLVSRIVDLRSKIIGAEVSAVHQALAEVTRLLRLGTQTAELMSALR